MQLFCGALVSHAIDLDFAIDHHTGNYAGARRRIVAKVFPEYFVEGLEVARIIEPNTAAHYVLGSVACFVQNGNQILYCLVRLSGYVARDDFPVHHGHLSGNVEPSIGLHSASEWEMLTSGTPTAFSAVAFYTHRVDSTSLCI